MSYSTDVKAEICSNAEPRACCDRALLNSAMAFFNTVNSKKVQFRTSSQAAALYLYALIREITGVSFDISRNKDSYILSLNDEDKIKIAAAKAGLIDKENGQITCAINGSYSLNECCLRSAAKGAFLAAGYIASPKMAYHFEIVSHRRRLVGQLADIMSALDINAKIIKRNSKYVLYIKEKEQISDMLSLLGATKMFFEYQEVMLEKEIKNEINRKQNFEQANLDKTLAASIEQCMAIKKIRESGRFEALDIKLKEAAALREEYPDSSLGELAAMTSDKVSRSGMNHRLKKIVEIGRLI